MRCAGFGFEVPNRSPNLFGDRNAVRDPTHDRTRGEVMRPREPIGNSDDMTRGVSKLRSGFSDVDSSGNTEHLVNYLDAARQAPSVIEAKQWSLDRLALRPEDAALDVGCGTGEDVVALLQLGRVRLGVGVDRSTTMVAEAVRRHQDWSHVHFAVADAHDLPLPSSSFDAIRCERTLQHVEDPATAVAEMARLLRAGGRLTLQEPDWGTLVIEGADPALTDLVTAHHVNRHAQPRIGRQLAGLMTANGLSVEEIGGTAVIYTDLPSALRAFGLGQAAPRLVVLGLLHEDAGENWIRELREADRENRFLASVTGFRAFGSKPS